MRSFKHTVSDMAGLRAGLIRFAERFDDAVILDSLHEAKVLPGYDREYRILAGFGSRRFYPAPDHTWEGLDDFLRHQKHDGEYVLGYLSYDIKNNIEDLKSENPDRTGFPEVFLMVPEVLVIVTDGSIEIRSHDSGPEEIYAELGLHLRHPVSSTGHVDLKPVLSRSQYLEKVRGLQEHIQRGDIYEVNFCHEFYSDHAEVDAYETYIRLGEDSPNPFGCFVKHEGRFLLCASPERFLRMASGMITSQPMKGTMPRHQDPALDEEYRTALEHSVKDKAENVMIVDLTRNDLSRIAKRGSVRVPELYRVHSFPNVHQMVSTVQCDVRDDVQVSEILTATFPMGSMTGAPKVRAMQLIEEYEPMKRGIFSGTAGYFAPDGSFDLNVVIRSIMYSESDHVLSVMAGGAITNMSDPEREYEESLVKMKPLFRTLGYTFDPATGEYA